MQATNNDGKGSGTSKPWRPDRPAFPGRPHVLTNNASPVAPAERPASSEKDPKQPEVPEEEAAQASSGIKDNRNGAAEAADEEVQIAFVQLDAAPEASKEVLRKILSNILAQPAEPKYRRVRLANPRIKEAVVDVEGALELLQVQQIYARQR